ncbi:MAG: Lrp/AsnC family transcriptional regulator [Clostridia bacterium]|nr:Lrp/AsnC family transcriptional regulator [Clostridia bacterium]
MEPILELLSENCLYSTRDIAAMLDMTEEEVEEKIASYKRDGILLGCQAIIDYDKTDANHVHAFIELKVNPQPDRGFDRIAENIYRYPEVKSLYLMSSSGYDLLVTVEGSTMKEIAYFVARKLAPIEGVVSTSTHFVLKKYKSKGIIHTSTPVDERENCN